MAVNPLATKNSDDNTLSMTDLLRIPVGSRVSAAQSSSSFVDMILNSLTPIQIAQAFPDYYRDAIPDVSNFITKNIDAKLAAAGRGYDQVRGGSEGTARPGYTGESKTGQKDGKSDTTPTPAGTPPPTFEEMKAKLLKNGIDIDNIREVITEKGVLAGDKRLAALKKLSKDQLAEAGFEKVETEDGKTLIRETATQASQMSDEEISKKISGKYVAKNTATENQKAILAFANRWNISPEAAAGVFHVESRVTNSATNGSHHGVFQLRTDQVDDLSEAAGFGRLSPAEFRNLSVPDQLKVMDEYYKYWKVKPDFFTGDPKTDAAKMWSLQLAPGNAKKIDYNNPNIVISGPGQAAEISSGGRGGPVTVGSASEGSVNSGIKYMGESLIRIEGTATDDQIKEARQKLIEEEETKRQSDFAESLYEQESPTSSDATVDRTGTTIINSEGYAFPVTAKMDHEGHGKTSHFGAQRENRKHMGVDLYTIDPETGKLSVGNKAPVGSPIDGTITAINKNARVGYRKGLPSNLVLIEIKDKNGYRHRFLHVDPNLSTNSETGKEFKVGDKIKQGEIFSYVAGTGTQFGDKAIELGSAEAALEYFNKNGWGSVTKPHLHYELLDNKGNKIDPALIFPEYSGSDKNAVQFISEQDRLRYMLTTNQISQKEFDEKMKISQQEIIAASEEEATAPETKPVAQMSDDEVREMHSLKLKKSYEEGMLTEEQYKKALNYKMSVDDMRAELEEDAESEENPYLGKSVEELRRMTSEQYDLRENILKKSGKKYYEDSDWMKAKIEEEKMYDALEEAIRREKKTEDRREELGIGPDVTGEGLVLSNQNPEVYGPSIETDRSQALRQTTPTVEELQLEKINQQSKLNSLGEDAPSEERDAIKTEIEELKGKIEEQSSAEAPAPVTEEEPQKMAQGGFINEKDNLSVINEDGKTLAKINEGEMLGGMLTEGTGMRVISNKTRLADDIVERNSMESPAQQSAIQQPDSMPQNQKPPVMSKNQLMKEDNSWREMAANDSHQRGTQIRAFRRTKFMPEGYHFNRATPSSRA